MSVHSTWWGKLGREPKCFGQFVQGQPKCDGYPQCSHLAPCRVWVGLSSHLDSKILPGEFRQALTEDGFQRIMWSSCRAKPGEGSTAVRLTRQWQEFFDALRGTLPVGLREVAPGEEISRLGGLYVAAIPQKGRLPAGWRLYEKTVGSSKPICTYIPRPITRPTPSISVRVSLGRLRVLAPWVGEWADEWVERDGSSVALRVQPSRVAMLGRMVGQFWSAGVLDGQHNSSVMRWETPLACKGA